METSFHSIVEVLNQRTEFVTKIWAWIIVLTLFGLIIFSQNSQPLNPERIKELYELLPKSGFKDVEELHSFITDESKLKEIYRLIPKGFFKDEDEYLSYFSETFSVLGQSKTNGKQILIPIIDISVPSNYFVLIFLFVLTGLIIRWVESFLRLISFRQKVLEPLFKKNHEIKIGKQVIDTRPLFDGLACSASTGIWGIVPDFKDNKRILNKIIRLVSYSLLKFISLLVHFILPGFVIISAFKRLDFTASDSLIQVLSYLAVIVSSVALMILLIAIIAEIKYCFKIIKERIFLNESGLNGS